MDCLAQAESLSIDQYVRRHRVDAVLLVVGVSDGRRYLAQERIVCVAHVRDVAQFLIRGCLSSVFHEPVTLSRRDED